MTRPRPHTTPSPWLAPPSRRELALTLAALALFTLSYNLDASLSALGYEPLAAEGAVEAAMVGIGGTLDEWGARAFGHNPLGLGWGLGWWREIRGSRVIGADGRKLPGRRDRTEEVVWGEWEWRAGEVAGGGYNASAGVAYPDDGGLWEEVDSPSQQPWQFGDPRHRAFWASEETRKKAVLELSEKERAGEVNSRLGLSQDQGILYWRDGLPTTKVLKHLPGYTILDNVFMYQGAVYLVRDDEANSTSPDELPLPPMHQIVASPRANWRSKAGRWAVLNKRVAREIFGAYGGAIRGVSWLDNDPTPHNSTLFALWRLYTLLDPALSRPNPRPGNSNNTTTPATRGTTPLPQPRRLLLPHTPAYADDEPPEGSSTTDILQRVRAPTGFHPYLAKALLPKMGVLYRADWDDYMEMEMAWWVERVVVVDRRVAVAADTVLGRPGVGRLVEEGVRLDEEARDAYYDAAEDEEEEDDEFAEGEEDGNDGLWWEPLRRNLRRYFDIEEPLDLQVTPRPTAPQNGATALLRGILDKVPFIRGGSAASSRQGAQTKVVTYIHTQDELGGIKLSNEEHGALVEGLTAMVKARKGWEVKIVSSVDWQTGWNERMGSVVRSEVVLGVHGPHLMDSLFMKRTPSSVLMEFFPLDTFSREYEMAVRSVGLGYRAWSGRQQFSDDDLPPVSPPGEGDNVVDIDVKAVVESVKKVLGQASG